MKRRKKKAIKVIFLAAPCCPELAKIAIMILLGVFPVPCRFLITVRLQIGGVFVLVVPGWLVFVGGRQQGQTPKPSLDLNQAN